MSDITYFTKKQNTVEKWITDMGVRVKSEVDVEQYRVDLAIKDLDIVVEVDGPSHRKLKSKGNFIAINSPQKSKRDMVVLQYFPNGIWHIPVDIEEETFKTEFKNILEELN